MPFNPGDKIKYLNEEGGGTVLRLIGDDKLEILGDDGFKYILKKSEVIAEGKSSIDEKEITERLNKFTQSTVNDHIVYEHNPRFRSLITDYLMSSRQNWTSKDKDFIEIDLHIEELLAKPKYMNDGQKLHFQLDHARHCLEEVINIKMKRIIFIHGVGSGVLRDELRKWLKTMSYLQIIDAKYQRYGIGATEVKIKI